MSHPAREEEEVELTIAQHAPPSRNGRGRWKQSAPMKPASPQSAKVQRGVALEGHFEQFRFQVPVLPHLHHRRNGGKHLLLERLQ